MRSRSSKSKNLVVSAVTFVSVVTVVSVLTAIVAFVAFVVILSQSTPKIIVIGLADSSVCLD